MSLLAFGLALSAFSASAASLGGLNTSDLFAQSGPASAPVPAAIVDTDFSGCQNTIDGWTDSLGNTWISHSGNWQCLGSDTVRAQQRRPFAHASVALGQGDGLRITTVIDRISTQRNRSGPGLGVLSNGATFVYVVYDGDDERLSIGHFDGGIGTAWTSIENLPVSAPAVLSAVIDRPDIEISLNGSQLLDIDLTDYLLPAEIDQLFTNARVGLVSDNDNFSAFDGYKVEALP